MTSRSGRDQSKWDSPENTFLDYTDGQPICPWKTDYTSWDTVGRAALSTRNMYKEVAITSLVPSTQMIQENFKSTITLIASDLQKLEYCLEFKKLNDWIWWYVVNTPGTLDNQRWLYKTFSKPLSSLRFFQRQRSSIFALFEKKKLFAHLTNKITIDVSF